MALAVTARQSGNSGQSAAQTLTTSSATESANSLSLTGSAAQNDLHTASQDGQTLSGGGLTYTQVVQTALSAYDGTANFRMRGAVHSAPVGGSPSAHTITVDHYITGAGGDEGFYCVVTVDVTGFDATTPIREVSGSPNVGTNAADLSSGDGHSGTVTLPNTPVAGNGVLAWFFAGADGGGGFEAGGVPTLGGQPMTRLFNQNNSWTQAGVWYREIDGTESTDVVTCPDLGQSVGQYNAIAVEIAADAATATDLDGTDTTQAQSATSAALTQTHELSADDATQAQTASSPALTQTHELTADGAVQAQQATAVALTQVHELQPSSAVQGQTATTAALTQTHELAATDAVQAQAADTAAVAEGVTLSPAGAVQGQVADTAALTQVHALAPVDVLQAQSADAAVLTQLHELVTASAVQAQVVVLPVVTVGELTTPASRIFAVQAEDRAFSVLAEDRTFEIAAESRRFAVT